MSDPFYAVVVNPLALYDLTYWPARDKWKYDRWAERFERRYGRHPDQHAGAIGTLYGVRIEG